MLDMIFMMIAGVLSGVIYFSSDFFPEISNLNIFYAITLFIIIISFVKYPKVLKFEQVFNNISKEVALASSFLIAFVGFVHIYVLYASGGNYYDFILPVLAEISAYSLLAIYVSIKKEKIYGNNFLSVPVFWVIFELIFIFRDSSVNPNLTEFVLELLVLASCSMVLLQFAKAFCTQKRKIFFKPSFYICVYLTTAYGFSVFAPNSLLELTFEAVRVFVIAVSVLIFMSPFALSTKK